MRMDKAVKLESKDIPGFFITIGEDGIWCHFEIGGKHFAENMTIHNPKTSFAHKILVEWAEARINDAGR